MPAASPLPVLGVPSQESAGERDDFAPRPDIAESPRSRVGDLGCGAGDARLHLRDEAVAFRTQPLARDSLPIAVASMAKSDECETLPASSPPRSRRPWLTVPVVAGRRPEPGRRCGGQSPAWMTDRRLDSGGGRPAGTGDEFSAAVRTCVLHRVAAGHAECALVRADAGGRGLYQKRTSTSFAAVAHFQGHGSPGWLGKDRCRAGNGQHAAHLADQDRSQRGGLSDSARSLDELGSTERAAAYAHALLGSSASAAPAIYAPSRRTPVLVGSHGLVCGLGE